MANDNYPQLEWHHCIQIQAHFEVLAVLKGDVPAIVGTAPTAEFS